MNKTTVMAGVAAAFLMSAVSVAQTTSGPSAAPSDVAKQPLASATPSGTPYSDSDSSNTPMNSSPNAAQHGSDSAARTPDASDATTADQCKAMSSETMMKDATCAQMAKKHPTLKNSGDGAPR